MKKIIGFLTCFIILAAQTKAQEKLYLKNQREPIPCKIIEINSTEIKYQPNDAEQLTIGINKLDAEKIVFKSGRVQYFTDPLEDFGFYKGQKRWVAKVGLLSPAFGYTDLYLEKSLKPGKSVEFQANIIGLGKNMTFYNSYVNSDNLYVNQKGATVGIGLKVLRMPDYELANRKLMHILQGSYIKPAINIGYYTRDFIIVDPLSGNYTFKNKGIVTSQFAIILGKQWILDNTISMEIYGSLGMGVDNFRSQQSKINKDNGGGYQYFQDETIPYQNFGYTRFGRGDVGLTIGGGLKVGYLFNWKKPKAEVAGAAKTKEAVK